MPSTQVKTKSERVRKPGAKSKRKPTADMQLAARQTTHEDCKNIIAYMAEREVSLRSACAQLKFNRAIVVEMIYSNPELRALDSAARAHYMREKVRQMNEIVAREVDPQRARLYCDNIKWEASRIMRSEFGDKVTVSGDESAPLVVKHVQDSNELLNKIRGITIDHETESE